jgi:hypothetical protein
MQERQRWKVESLDAHARQILTLQVDCGELEDNCQLRIFETYLNAFAEVADSFSFC